MHVEDAELFMLISSPNLYLFDEFPRLRDLKVVCGVKFVSVGEHFLEAQNNIRGLQNSSWEVCILKIFMWISRLLALK